MRYKEYKKYMRSSKWKVRKNRVLEAQPCCNRCACAENLEVHHINYRSLGEENDDDLVVLCRKCHTHVHQYKSSPFGK